MVPNTNPLTRLTAQRDDLLAALKQIITLPSELARESWAIARRAIAKAEGGLDVRIARAYVKDGEEYPCQHCGDICVKCAGCGEIERRGLNANLIAKPEGN